MDNNSKRTRSEPHILARTVGVDQNLMRKNLSRWLSFGFPNQLRTYFLVASSYLVVLSPAWPNAQSSHGNQHRVVSDDSTIVQQEKPIRDDSMSTWGPLVLRIGRDVAYLVVPAMRLPASLGVAGAFLMAIYYDNQRPYPTTCHPPERDKWQHCYVGCKIATWCPVGSFSASMLAILKEVRDAMNRGEFSWADVFATLRGAWACTSCESCEACCCEQFGGQGR